MISEEEAKATVYALGTAMLHDDKELREFAYKDMSVEDLQRITRWAMRFCMTNFAQLAIMSDQDPLEAWKKVALREALGNVQEDDDYEEDEEDYQEDPD